MVICIDNQRVAGAVGFEPTIHDTKNRCLTTWLRPIKLEQSQHNFGNLAVCNQTINLKMVGSLKIRHKFS